MEKTANSYRECIKLLQAAAESQPKQTLNKSEWGLLISLILIIILLFGWVMYSTGQM